MSDMPKTRDGSIILRGAAEWFEHRSYDYRQFSDLEAMGRLKRDLGLTLSAILPCRNVADTVGTIVDEIHAVNSQSGDNPLVDQILVVDADSPDGTAEVAASKGAEVYSENELMSNHGGAHGKGDAMWRATPCGAHSPSREATSSCTSTLTPKTSGPSSSTAFWVRSWRCLRSALSRPPTDVLSRATRLWSRTVEGGLRSSRPNLSSTSSTPSSQASCNPSQGSSSPTGSSSHPSRFSPAMRSRPGS